MRTPDHITEIAQQAAAQCWCTPETSSIEMDVRLAEAFTRVLAGWIDSAAQFSRNAEFYRGLLDECAKHLGPEVFRCGDGSVSDSPLRLKIPELVAQLAQGKALTANTSPN
jgi:hypothetical protein